MANNPNLVKIINKHLAQHPASTIADNVKNSKAIEQLMQTLFTKIGLANVAFGLKTMAALGSKLKENVGRGKMTVEEMKAVIEQMGPQVMSLNLAREGLAFAGKTEQGIDALDLSPHSEF